jgi:tetratricopeptide (TPR) repeat protein
VGRLSEAVQPMKAAIENVIQLEDWTNAASGACTLSELYLTLGDVASAENFCEQSVAFADRSGNDFPRSYTRARLADVYHQYLKMDNANEMFSEAEEIEKKSGNYYLNSLSGFQFCDLLLSIGKYQEVLERAQTTIKEVKNLLSIALDKLSIGKVLLFQTIDNHSAGYSEAPDYLNQAVDGLREAGTQHHLPRALFARATLFRHQNDFLKSWTDIDEAREIAEYGQMRLYLTDYHLEACRNIRDQLANKDYQIIEDGETLSLTKEEMQARFQEHFKKAERLVQETGYHRRDGELKELRVAGYELRQE